MWQVGEDPKGKIYKNQAQALVESLVQYQAQNGELPSSLSALVPKNIDALPDVVNYSYYSKEKEFLEYNYTPSWPQPGRISCSTLIGTNKWACGGYY